MSGCAECKEYWGQRSAVVRPHIERKADETGRDLVSLFEEFVGGVHERHLSGLSLDTEVLPDRARGFRNEFIYGVTP